MPTVEIQLNQADLELLGTDNQAQQEADLAMLAEVALADIPEQILLPAPQPSRATGEPDTTP